MLTISPYLEELAGQATNPGGWGYVAGQAAQLEPTCLALLALTLEKQKYTSQIQSGLSFLESCRRPDASFRLALGREEAVWPTAQVLFTLARLNAPGNRLSASAGFLLHTRGKAPDHTEKNDVTDINLKLIGWPWAAKNFSWVEPTAWACLALRQVGQENHSRVQEGLELLLDRVMEDGGVNYGNRRILGRNTEPQLGPSALFLLALQGKDHPGVKATVQYVLGNLNTHDLEHLCWARLALELHRQEPGVPEGLEKLRTLIQEAHALRKSRTWLKPNPLRQALTALALAADENNLFRLQAPLTPPLTLPSPVEEVSSSIPFTKKVGTWFRDLVVKTMGGARPLPARSAVHIARADRYDESLVPILQRQYELFREMVPLKGKRVVLKPNMVEYHRDKVINTHPQVVSAVIQLCKGEGAAEVIVAEGPGHCRNVEHIVAECGLGEVLARHGVSFVDINHDEPVKKPNLGRCTGLDVLYLAKTIVNADVVISLPKLKTHHWAGATLSLKNLFGTLPGICYGWPKNELHWRGIENSIVDIALTRTPNLAIVDGILGMEGDGPLNGTAKPLGALVMGNDLVAVDATCSRLMEFDPERMGYLVLGASKRLGRLKAEEIEQLGESIASLAQPFATVPHLEGLCVRRSA